MDNETKWVKIKDNKNAKKTKKTVPVNSVTSPLQNIAEISMIDKISEAVKGITITNHVELDTDIPLQEGFSWANIGNPTNANDPFGVNSSFSNIANQIQSNVLAQAQINNSNNATLLSAINKMAFNNKMIYDPITGTTKPFPSAPTTTPVPTPTPKPTPTPTPKPKPNIQSASPCENMGSGFKKYSDELLKVANSPRDAINSMLNNTCEFIFNTANATVYQVEKTNDNILKKDEELPDAITFDTNNPDHVSDRAVVKAHMKLFFIVLISCFIVYNVYFVLIYQQYPWLNAENVHEHIPLTYVSTHSMLDMPYHIGVLLYVIFHYLMVPVIIADSGLHMLQTITQLLPSKQIIFSLLFLLSIVFIYNCGDYLLTSFANFMSLHSDEYFTPFFQYSMLLYAITSEIRPTNEKYKDVEEKWFMLNLRMYGFPMFIMFILRISFSLKFMWIAGLMVLLYIFFVLFGSILWYTTILDIRKEHAGIHLFDTIRGINRNIYVQTPVSLLDNPYSSFFRTTTHILNDIYTPNFIKKIFSGIKWIQDMIFIYIMNIVFIGIFIYGILDFNGLLSNTSLKAESLKLNEYLTRHGLNPIQISNGIKSMPLKISLTILYSLCILIVCFIGFYEWYQHGGQDRHALQQRQHDIELASVAADFIKNIRNINRPNNAVIPADVVTAQIPAYAVANQIPVAEVKTP